MKTRFALLISVLLLVTLACQTALPDGVPQISVEFPDANSGNGSVDTPSGATFPDDNANPLTGGSSRQSPYPANTLVQAWNIDVEVLDVVRGEQAWQMTRQANQFNDPPPDGFEYVAVRLYVKNTGFSQGIEISGGDFSITGSSNVRRRPPSIVDPAPVLDAELAEGEDTSGWSVYMVASNETDLMLIVDLVSFGTYDGEFYTYIALEDAASIAPTTQYTGGAPTQVGAGLQTPARLTEAVTTSSWQVTALEMVRGEEAYNLIIEENQFNDPPPEGFEYILVYMRARYLGLGDDYGWISDLDFEAVGPQGQQYDAGSVVQPKPDLSYRLFPGGVGEGWVAVIASVEMEGVRLVFEPPGESDTLRYILLEY